MRVDTSDDARGAAAQRRQRRQQQQQQRGGSSDQAIHESDSSSQTATAERLRGAGDEHDQDAGQQDGHLNRQKQWGEEPQGDALVKMSDAHARNQVRVAATRCSRSSVAGEIAGGAGCDGLRRQRRDSGREHGLLRQRSGGGGGARVAQRGGAAVRARASRREYASSCEQLRAAHGSAAANAHEERGPLRVSLANTDDDMGLSTLFWLSRRRRRHRRRPSAMHGLGGGEVPGRAGAEVHRGLEGRSRLGKRLCRLPFSLPIPRLSTRTLSALTTFTMAKKAPKNPYAKATKAVPKDYTVRASGALCRARRA